jgi:hypothetical protein
MGGEWVGKNPQNRPLSLILYRVLVPEASTIQPYGMGFGVCLGRFSVNRVGVGHAV